MPNNLPKDDPEKRHKYIEAVTKELRPPEKTEIERLIERYGIVQREVYDATHSVIQPYSTIDKKGRDELVVRISHELVERLSHWTHEDVLTMLVAIETRRMVDNY